jgi:hypothetical protein
VQVGSGDYQILSNIQRSTLDARRSTLDARRSTLNLARLLKQLRNMVDAAPEDFRERANPTLG